MWTRSELEVLAGDPAWRDRQIKRLLGGAFWFLPCWLKPFQNERWKEPEEMKRQLCLECLDKDRPPRSASGRLAVTEHFILVRAGLGKKLYYSPYFRNLERTSKGFTYWFRDLTKFILPPEAETDMTLLKNAIQKHGLTVHARILNV